MNIAKHQISIISFILFIISLVGCSNNELSREEAKKIIKPTIKSIETQEFEIYTGGLGNRWETQKFLLSRKLENLGLVNIIWHNDIFGYTIQSMELSEKGKQYVISMREVSRWDCPKATCKLSDIEFGEITGISQKKESNTALVKYTLVRKVTPFGKALGLQDGYFENSANFSLYDDGWRID